MKNALALVFGFVFAVGLAVSTMTNPAKVIGFLDVDGAWDPSLAFVMVGGLTVVAIAYRLELARPLLGERFPSFDGLRVDRKLVAGAALFGIGWGLVGFCPGPAIVALGAAVPGSVLFVASMVVGFALVQVSDL